MDLIQIRNIFRNILQKEFKNEQDLKLLMQFLALILSEYEQNSKLPDLFGCDKNIASSTIADISVTTLTARNSQTAATSSVEEVFKHQINRADTKKRPLIKEKKSDLDLRINKLQRFTKEKISRSQIPHLSNKTALNEATHKNEATKSTIASNLSTSIKSEPIDSNLSTTIKSKPIEQQARQTITSAASNSSDFGNNEDFIIPHLETIEKAINSDNKKDNSYAMIKEAWSLLSIITNKDQLKSKENCLVFLKNSQDLNLIVRQSKCLNKRLYTGVYLNMIGVLVNLSEFNELIHHFFKKDILNLLRELLKDQNHALAYLASRVLVNIIASNQWLAHEINKDHECEQVAAEINTLLDSLDLIYMNDSSFETILKLLNCNIDICIKWACWTLFHLAYNEFYKYRPMLQDAACSNLLKSIVTRMDLDDSIKNIAKEILNTFVC